MGTKMAAKRSECLDGLLKELHSGFMGPDEFFCMLVSYLGNEETEKSFLSIISGVKCKPNLHQKLTQIFDDYFIGIHSFKMPIDQPINNLEDDLDFQLAVKLSLQEQAGALGGSDIYEDDSKEEEVAISNYIRTNDALGFLDYDNNSVSLPDNSNRWALVVAAGQPGVAVKEVKHSIPPQQGFNQ